MPFTTVNGELITDRLVLRPWTDADVAAVTTGTRLPHFAEDFPAEGEQVIAGLIQRDPNTRHEFGQRQIVEQDSGLVVGGVGLFWPAVDGAIEFGYGLSPSRRGRGYATEAARAIIAFGLTAPGVERVFADVEVANPASERVLQRLGLHRWSADAELARYGTTPAP